MAYKETMRSSLVVIGCIAVLLGLAGATGCLGQDDGTDGNSTVDGVDTGGGEETSTQDGGEDTGDTNGSEASYEQEKHMGCQPGAINKNGSCTVAFSGENAEIFNAQNLTPITGSNVSMGGTPGYMARPADNGSYPAVVMIHEWWGLNENIRHMADVLAGHGYTVFAVDLYDGRVAMESSRAAELSGEVRDNPDEAVTKLTQATEGLRNSQYTTDRVASLGWCFGGGWSLQLSLSDAELNSTVIYYGTLTTEEEELESIDEPVLGIFGSEDQVVGIESVRDFESTLTEVGVENNIQVYEGAEHAFANPSGESFRPNATRDSWERTLEFLNGTLRQ